MFTFNLILNRALEVILLTSINKIYVIIIGHRSALSQVKPIMGPSHDSQRAGVYNLASGEVLSKKSCINPLFDSLKDLDESRNSAHA